MSRSVSLWRAAASALTGLISRRTANVVPHHRGRWAESGRERRERQPPETGAQMDDVHRTEVDGLCVTWRMFQDQLISILAVHNTFDVAPVVCFGPDIYPDLARARELLPKLTALWDAVRHDLWTELIPPLPRATIRSRSV